jgi:methionyl-tRNA formyltransferase
MRAALLSRYPRVDTPVWKQRVAAGLLDAGVDLLVLHSNAGLIDQARAGLREGGLGVLRRYRDLRSANGGEPQTRSLPEWAHEHGVPVNRIRTLDNPVPLREFGPDVLVLVGAAIVPTAVLAIPRLGTINAHYGLLPAYRGMNVTEWSVLRGDPVGVTVHLVDSGVDTGPILLQEPIELSPGETFATLRRKHQEVAARLLVRAALELGAGALRPRPQRPGDGKQYYRMHAALRRMAEAGLTAQRPGP